MDFEHISAKRSHFGRDWGTLGELDFAEVVLSVHLADCGIFPADFADCRRYLGDALSPHLSSVEKSCYASATIFATGVGVNYKARTANAEVIKTESPQTAAVQIREVRFREPSKLLLFVNFRHCEVGVLAYRRWVPLRSFSSGNVLVASAAAAAADGDGGRVASQRV